MALPSTGETISANNIQTEIGGASPINLSEYYRSGTYIPSNASSNIPLSGNPISLSNFYSTTITYEIIGGGGAGGDSWVNNHDSVAAISTQSGANSTIVGAFVNISANGGAGGINGIGPNGATGLNGEASFYGAGGTGGALNTAGSAPAASSYGAGGGGAGGDSGSLYDEGGPRGEGGYAGTRLTGSINAIDGTVLTITIGRGGSPYTLGSYDGGAGAAGICKITKNGIITTFTANGTYTV